MASYGLREKNVRSGACESYGGTTGRKDHRTAGHRYRAVLGRSFEKSFYDR